MGVRCILAVAVLSLIAHAQPADSWRLTRSEHFELYSQTDDATARSALVWFEQLRAFYLQKTGLAAESLRPVRVICFRSAREYEPYRLHPASDAHYIGTEGRDYIVMASLGPRDFAVAAHEYAHSVMHAAGLKLPPWLSEGLAEFYSTVHMNAGGCTLGGDLPARSQALQRNPWITLADLVAMPASSPIQEVRESAGVFYAESWALADMLMLSPGYGSRFADLLSALTLGAAPQQVLQTVYGKSLAEITEDLRAWTATKHAPVPLDAIQTNQPAVQASKDVSPLEVREMLGDMLLAAGNLERAGAIYRDLEREMPSDPTASAALGTIALRAGDKEQARRQWKRAIELGIRDAKLCFDYASLAEMAGLPESDLRPALERAVALKPDFDDARYHLALLERNSGRYESALTQLRAMRNVAPIRAFHYWMAMADSLIQLDRREEAQAAAKHAMEHAETAVERRNAAQLAYIAATDFAVQFTSGADGRVELESTRIPHNTANWNPFVEPGDKMRHVEGALREVDCSSSVTRFVVETSQGHLKLAIADPSRVQMRNAPSEFTCGPQKRALKVAVDYAESAKANGSAGVIRGMAFQ